MNLTPTTVCLLLVFTIGSALLWRRLKLKFSLRTLLLLSLLTASSAVWFKNRHAWKPYTTIPSIKGEHDQIDFSPTDDRLAVWSKGNRLRIWNMGTQKCELEQQLSVPAHHIQYAPDGKGLILYYPGAVYRFDLETQRLVLIWSVPLSRLGWDAGNLESLIAVSPDGKKIALEVVRVVTTPTGKLSTRSSEEEMICIKNTDGTNRPFRIRLKGTSVGHARFSDDGHRFGVVVDSTLHLFDLRKRNSYCKIPALGSWGCRFSFMPGERIAITNAFDAAKIHDGRGGKKLEEVPAEDQFDISYGPHSDRLATTSSRQDIVVWNRRRPEGAWLPHEFPEAWLTFTLAILLLGSAIKDGIENWGSRRSISILNSVSESKRPSPKNAVCL